MLPFSLWHRLLCRAQLGLGDGAALDFGTPADEALRAAVESLEQRNRALLSENKRLRVERVRLYCAFLMLRHWLCWGVSCCACLTCGLLLPHFMPLHLTSE